MTKEELIEEYIKWSGHPYKDLAHAFHTDLIAFAKHCLDKSIKLLEIANCPNCDGSGVTADGNPEDPDWIQCQWCAEKEDLVKESTTHRADWTRENKEEGTTKTSYK